MPLVKKAMSSEQQRRWLECHLPYRIKILRGLDYYDQHNGPRNPILTPLHPSIFEATLLVCRWTANFLGFRLGNGNDLKPIIAPGLRVVSRK